MSATALAPERVIASQICVGDTIDIVSADGSESYRYLVTDLRNPPPAGVKGMPLDYLEGLLLDSDDYHAYRIEASE